MNMTKEKTALAAFQHAHSFSCYSVGVLTPFSPKAMNRKLLAGSCSYKLAIANMIDLLDRE